MRSRSLLSFCLCAYLISLSSFAQKKPKDPESPDAVSSPLPIARPIEQPTIPESTSTETFGLSDNFDGNVPQSGESMSSTSFERSSRAPQTYEIVKGDTLWDICKKILGDPWYWPKLWALNDYISNPHLIYPGNLIKFYAGSETAPPRMMIGDSGEPDEGVFGDSNSNASETKFHIDKSFANVFGKTDVIRLRPLIYISKKKPRVLGKVSHSGLPKLELVFGDTAYLEFHKKMKVSVGDKFHVIDYVQEVSDPERPLMTYGTMVRKNAVVEINKITRTAIEARIIGGDRSIRRGDDFIEYKDDVKDIKPFATKKSIQGRIIATENEKILIGQNEFAFINLGKSSGVKEGMRFYVVKKGDGMLRGDDEHLPYVIIGNCFIVDVRDNTSLMYVSSLRETLEVGFTVRTVVP
ncbi:MAG: LysM peptidoglycan-binding domain-containing protein [Bdellovibrionales bacterium]|nr:LysM peptidoglycan-binding domain-containing protein [Bdellovibrionales bacterium]